MFKIGVVTILYNCETVLRDFYKSLREQTFKDFILYVIDNKSTDGSLALAKELSGEVPFKCKLLAQPDNYGVAKGNNIGIKEALKDGCEWILLSNNDIVLEKDTIEVLLKETINKKATISIPKIYFWNTDRIFWCAGGYYSFVHCNSPHIGKYEKDEGQYDQVTTIEYAPTCFMLIHKDVFNRVGFMDERYFVYFDDGDFIWRAVHQNNEKLILVPQTYMWHKVSVSTGGHESSFTIYYDTRNCTFFTLKNYPFYRFIILMAYRVTKYITRDIFKRSKEYRQITRRATIDGIKMYYKG